MEANNLNNSQQASQRLAFVDNPIINKINQFGIGILFFLVVSSTSAILQLISVVYIYISNAVGDPRLDYFYVMDIILFILYFIWIIVLVIAFIKRYKDAIFLTKSLLIYTISYNIILTIVVLLTNTTFTSGKAFGSVYMITSSLILSFIYLIYFLFSKEIKTKYPQKPIDSWSVAFVVFMILLPICYVPLGIVQGASYAQFIDRQRLNILDSVLPKKLSFTVPDGFMCHETKREFLGNEIVVYTLDDDLGNSIILYSVNEDNFTIDSFNKDWHDVVGDSFGSAKEQVLQDITSFRLGVYDGRMKKSVFFLKNDIKYYATFCKIYNRIDEQECAVLFLQPSLNSVNVMEFLQSIKYN